jgi:hypothetical protein
MSMNGWIKLHRQIEENEFYFDERFTKVQAWIDLLLLAGHKERTIWIRGNEIHLNPGDLAWSMRNLSKRWRWNRRTTELFLSALEKREMIHRRKSNITTLVSIINWHKYQVDAPQSAPQSAPQKSEKVHTNKNVYNKNKLITAAKSLITGEYQDKELYSIIGKYKKLYGADEVQKIIGGCISGGNEFKTPGNLAAYLQACSTNGIPKAVHELEYLK